MTGEVGREMYLIVTIDFYISIKIDTESYFLYFATHDPLSLLLTGDGGGVEQQNSNFVM